MKKLFFLSTIVALFAACNNKDEAPVYEFQKPQYAAQAVKMAVTSVTTTSATPVAPVEFKSIEFTEDGIYIIRKGAAPTAKSDVSDNASDVFITGRYTFSNGVYTMVGFGTAIIKNNNGVVSIELKTDGGEPYHLEGELAKPLADEQAATLCRTWLVKKTRISFTKGVSVAADFNNCNLNEIEDFVKQYVTLNKSLEYGMNVTGVTFSAAGTYLVTYSNGKADVGTWNWADDDHKRFSYKWEIEGMGRDWQKGTACAEVASNFVILSNDASFTNDGEEYDVTVYMTLGL